MIKLLLEIEAKLFNSKILYDEEMIDNLNIVIYVSNKVVGESSL